jgi:hypothetical protein
MYPSETWKVQSKCRTSKVTLAKFGPVSESPQITEEKKSLNFTACKGAENTKEKSRQCFTKGENALLLLLLLLLLLIFFPVLFFTRL